MRPSRRLGRIWNDERLRTQTFEASDEEVRLNYAIYMCFIRMFQSKGKWEVRSVFYAIESMN